MATITSTGPAVNGETVARALLGGDGTYSLTGQPYTGAGIIVALPGIGETFDGLTLRVEDAADITESVAAWVTGTAAPFIAAHPAPFYHPHYVGSWVDSDTGTLYLDVVEIFPREEIVEAIAAGRDRNQIAIWDAGRQELIETGGTGE